ncbi:MAG: DNA mismatch repair endonuclease MutL [Clostridia bacterium]|nr:DNA mismatch repair endonuclease MutL [Clostridia bacterium]
MAKINVLDSSIFNLISAGEVVDKPMSVVKELVENSIDAGATVIEIEIKGGGIEYIRVTDNGCGIDKDEMPKAFMPHATSKISSVEDLNSILTLGFRGEALASISAVAKVTLLSRTENAELGYSICMESGEQITAFETGAPKGTTITVEDIFKNIPARQKFLRTPQAEEADIFNLMTRLILANPKISFRCTLGSKKIFSSGESEKSALIAVYGNGILENMEEISLVMPDITIRGFIGKPSFSKHSRNYQTLIVNGRYVKNEEISFLTYLCYKDFLMTRQYPTYVLYIDLPADMVDVNVHPSKMEVKFVQLDKIKKHIKTLINEKLAELTHAPKSIPLSDVFDDNVDSSITASEQARASKFDFSLLGIKSSLKEERNTQVKSYDLLDNDKNLLQRPYFTVSPRAEGQPLPYSNNAAKETLFASQCLQSDSFLGEEEILTVGTLFSTYVIIERGENCYLIDQHAAHERILYDKLVKKINEQAVVKQKLLIPYTFEVTAIESQLLDENMEIFSSCGFEIEKNGAEYVINAVPSDVCGMSLSKFLPMFFEAIDQNELDVATIIKDKLAQTACKAAVKGNKLLSMEEIRMLVQGVDSLDVLLCPHGRPIVVKLSKLEVDKWFKRK